MTERVLVGMSIREADAASELRVAAEEAGARLAFLQISEPALSTVLNELADAGATRIELVGVSFGPLAPGLSWLRRVAAHWWRERGPEPPEIMIATALVGPEIGEHGAIEAAAQEVRPIRGTEPVIAVQPDDVWYGGILPTDVTRLIDAHLVAGRPLDEKRIR
ncbi:(2Fe-2S) ferredoxin domain-containing protein [Cumulibacter soli]|uniref:(2Fe-2S) ferredoxin domain-containing protein n=1 Tax=Cumulibacter soli TaxID=2546344 RepID=UPI0010684BA8|nr:(2Fe-2S) ferredoxin domain-containing protein [Cumulibacter soli]